MTVEKSLILTALAGYNDGGGAFLGEFTYNTKQMFKGPDNIYHRRVCTAVLGVQTLRHRLHKAFGRGIYLATHD